MRRTPVPLIACALIGCISHFRSARVQPEHASALREAGHDHPFAVQSENGTLQVGPETRLRIQTQAGWSGWINLRELRVYEGGVYLRKEMPLEGVGMVRIENPTPDLLFAMQNVCHLRGPCFASLSVFTQSAHAPELVVPLYSTCISPDEMHLLVEVGANPSQLFPDSALFPGDACGWTKPSAAGTSIAARTCQSGALCATQSWMGIGGGARKIALQRVSAIELRETSTFGRSLGEQLEWFVEIGSRLRTGRWAFFSNDDPVSALAVFEVRRRGGTPIWTRRSLPPWAFEVAAWPIRDHFSALIRLRDSLTSIRIDRPSNELLHVLRAMCRSERERSAAGICGSPLWLYRARQKAEDAQPEPDAIEQTTLKQLSSPLDAQGRPQTLSADELSSIELAELNAAVIRELAASEVLLPERTADRWIFYSRRPVPTTAFDAGAGQLPTQVAGQQLVQTAKVPWESIVQFEFEQPGVLGACGSAR